MIFFLFLNKLLHRFSVINQWFSTINIFRKNHIYSDLNFLDISCSMIIICVLLHRKSSERVKCLSKERTELMLVQARSLPVKLYMLGRDVFYIVKCTAFVTLQRRHSPRKTSRLFAHLKKFSITFKYVRIDDDRENFSLICASKSIKKKPLYMMLSATMYTILNTFAVIRFSSSWRKWIIK